MMKKIGEAYETLINKNKRNQYDTLGTKKFYKM
jgi:DnaJ-class molecular chaperone